MGEVVFDIETYGAEVFDHKNLKVSVVCLYNYANDQFLSFREEELAKLWPYLEKADRLIGYNSKFFDVPVLQNYYSGDLSKIPHLDILEQIKNALGFRLKLNDVAHATLGVEKSGNGLQAIEWQKQGEWEKIIKYCIDDVKITRDVYEFGKKNKQLFFKDLLKNTTRPFPVNFEAAAGAQATQMGINLTLPF
ncbi:MAG: DEAD/DEAH box helicase domain protein [Candidatus Magasanikbacteria bacterium GW2011_GWA2_45_39]|uniref:DEAD/DEAH box helicase domain protein n=2 Tax=Candidatus Magasanikiibacteriota TaxID=1752731 RepID=A0A0G1MYR9_9BACT|nr:MAG: DEAD/DEAH box helicase domain protein [Candidatus Magasanikbacteria bacterium GW2011_GWA2_45_39]KKU13526.1 MAG: DEAD/DEAH box helicase domain protein [Candidatus Magasanikbacteria bacterium GW2011_GWC2_45_8]HBW73943.1 hypothetical protein [Candidatus Magasanikbacteria bacterium]